MNNLSQYKPKWVFGIAAEIYATHCASYFQYMEDYEAVFFIDSMCPELPDDAPEPSSYIPSSHVKIILDRAERWMMENVNVIEKTT